MENNILNVKVWKSVPYGSYAISMIPRMIEISKNITDVNIIENTDIVKDIKYKNELTSSIKIILFLLFFICIITFYFYSYR